MFENYITNSAKNQYISLLETYLAVKYIICLTIVLLLPKLESNSDILFNRIIVIKWENSMNEKSVIERLVESLNEVSNLEVNETSLLIAIIKKNIEDLININMQKLNEDFLEKCEYYGRSITEVNAEKVEILNSYKDEFNKIASKFEEEYMGISLELQEAQANQKISIANMKKVLDIKRKFIESEEYKSSKGNSEVSIDVYNRKIDKLADKYIKYCGLEQACIYKLRKCNERVEDAISSVMQFEVGKLAVIEKNNILKVFSKILLKITGAKRFEKEYIFTKKQNIEKIRKNTENVVEELDKEIKNTLIILDAYNSKITQVCS